VTRGEERSSIFLLTLLTAVPLTESITRFVSLMRLTPSVLLCGFVGLFFLVVLIIHIGLTSDG
jgi:formate/nitrite transporter FocA (FNT family)